MLLQADRSTTPKDSRSVLGVLATRHHGVFATFDRSTIRPEQLLGNPKQFLDLWYGQSVEHLPAFSGTIHDESAFPQAGEVSGHVGLRTAHDLDQVGHPSFATEQLAQNCDSGRLREAAEHPGGQFRRGRGCSRHGSQGNAALGRPCPGHVL